MKGHTMYGIDVLFEVRRSAHEVQDCRLLVGSCTLWDTALDAFTDALFAALSHVERFAQDRWVVTALHARCIAEAEYEQLVTARDSGFKREWYDVPCRVTQGGKTLWFEGGAHE